MGTAQAPAPPAGWPRRKQATRKRLEDTSLRLFAEQGFEQTTVDDLAAASGVGRRTIFRYFPSKNDIVFGALDERLRVLAAELDAGRAGGLPLPDMMRRAFRVTSSYQPSERASLAVRIQLIATVPSLQAHAALRYRAWEDTVRAAVIACTGVHGGVYARACAKAVVAVMWAAFDTWRETGAGDDLAQIVDAALDVLASASRPHPAPADRGTGRSGGAGCAEPLVMRAVSRAWTRQAAAARAVHATATACQSAARAGRAAAAARPGTELVARRHRAPRRLALPAAADQPGGCRHGRPRGGTARRCLTGPPRRCSRAASSTSAWHIPYPREARPAVTSPW